MLGVMGGREATRCSAYDASVWTMEQDEPFPVAPKLTH